MSRGFLSGVIMGGVVGSVGLAVASQIARPPGTIWPAAEPVAVAPVAGASPDVTPGLAAGAGGGAASGPATDLAPPPGSEFARPLPEVVPVLPAADAGLTRAEAPVVAVPEAAEPQAPDTASAARPQPVPLEPAAPPAPETEASAPAVPAPGPASPTLAIAPRPEGTPPPGAPSAEAEPSAADLPPPPPLTPEEEAMLARAAAGAAGVDGAAPAGDPPALPRLIEPDPPGAPGAPAVSSRLPRIGDAAPETASDPAPDMADLPPIRRHARVFSNPQQRPLFSVLLRDTGGPDLDRESLAALPFPVTFVIDPQAPDAATAAAMYRAAGHEVLMLATGIPEGALASDIEVTLEAAALALPEAVGVIDLPEAGFQSARSLSTQVVEILEAQGRGLVTHDRGLNAADQVARREGVPAALVFRTLEGEGADAAAVRRTLDRAAFKAAQEGRVTVYGETRPETLKGLMEWTVEGRADSVTLAPVTAVMR